MWRDDKLLKTYVTQQLPEKQHWNAELLGCFGALAGSELMEHGELDEASDEEFSHLSPRFSRNGTKLSWDGSHVGTITRWGQNVSCHCRIAGHSGCRSPAARDWPSDNVLVDWLLAGIGGELSKTEHVQLGKQMLEQIRSE